MPGQLRAMTFVWLLRRNRRKNKCREPLDRDNGRNGGWLV